VKIDIVQKGTYQILKIEEDLNVISDLSELRFLIQGYLNQGKKYIAVSFTNTSYIYSGAIAVLIDCFKKIKKDNGELCIVEPNPEIHRIFQFLHLDQFIQIYASADDLPSAF
jgi:anti-anti-sigma factor